jgi:hypothetical protein
MPLLSSQKVKADGRSQTTAEGSNEPFVSRPSKLLGYVNIPLSLMIDGSSDLAYEQSTSSFGIQWASRWSINQEFMNTVAAECKVQKHHPEWTNIFNKTHVRWTTHKPLGLSSKDILMARFCDEAGTDHGELADVVDDGCGCGDFKPWLVWSLERR